MNHLPTAAGFVLLVGLGTACSTDEHGTEQHADAAAGAHSGADGGASAGGAAGSTGAGGRTSSSGGALNGAGGKASSQGGSPAASAGGSSSSRGGSPAAGAGGKASSQGGATAAGGGNAGSAGAGGNGAGGATSAGCDAPGLTWKTANKTNYTSYPDPGSEECIKYNGCMWAGQFAACDGKKAESWVSAHNIVAAFPDFKALSLHDLCLRKGSKTLVVTVLDTCGDSDCDGCCTDNKGDADELIDIESYTNERWGVADGRIEWADLGPTTSGGCN